MGLKEKKIALVGGFRSGTNYTRTIMEWNYECEMVYNAYGWKHGYIPIVSEGSPVARRTEPVVFVTKNPFSSIRSLYKYYKSVGRNVIADVGWKRFLRGRFITYDYFLPKSPQYRYSNVVDYWNSMNWNYSSLGVNDSISVHVAYEEMLRKPLLASNAVAKTLGLSERYRSKKQFLVPEMVTKNMNDSERPNANIYVTDKRFNRLSYGDEAVFKVFDREDIEFILAHLDLELVDRLNYTGIIERAEKLKFD